MKEFVDHLGNKFSSLKKLCEHHKIRYNRVLIRHRKENLNDIILDELNYKNQVNAKPKVEPVLDKNNLFYQYVYKNVNITYEELLEIYRSKVGKHDLETLNKDYSDSLSYLDFLRN